MLTSFFGKSNPINYLILSVFIVFGYLLGLFSESNIDVSSTSLFKHSLFIALSVFSLLLFDFIIRKNHFTKNNTFAILFFSCFMVMLPVVFLNHEILLANLLILLALRRIMSLRSDTNSEKKILDSSFWITAASLYYFWSLLFIVPLYIAIIQKPNTNYKQMLIPFIGFFAVVILNTTYQLLTNDSFAWFFSWRDEISLDFSNYNSASILVPVTVLLAFYIWAGISRTAKIASIPSKSKPNYLLLFYVSMVSIVVALLGPEKTGAEVLFIMAPLSIIAANYIENFGAKGFVKEDVIEYRFKETLLWMVVLLPFVFMFL